MSRRVKDEVAAPRAMVTAKQPPAAEAAADVLERGGNAVDAAVVAALVGGVLLPLASGIGGGGYLVFHDAAAGTTHVVDYAMQSPSAAVPGFFDIDPAGGFGTGMGWRKAVDHANWHGWRSMCVPGAVAGLSTALERFGTIGFAEALAPAIALAEEGFPISPELASELVSNWPLLQAHPSSFATFTDSGRPLKAGDRLRRPALARTLRRLADHGPRDFYEGEIARGIAADMRDHGGAIDAADLAGY